MTVEFMAVQPGASQAIHSAEPATVTPPPPQASISKPKLLTKQSTVQKASLESSPVAEPQLSSATDSDSAKPMTPTIDETRPTSAETTPSPESQRPPIPSPPDAKDARNEYGALLIREIGKYKQYPQIARMRGWEGEVILELQLNENGNMLSCRIYQSSNRESLDNQALEMVKKASPFPLPPQSLRGRSFTILVPVSFKLE